LHMQWHQVDVDVAKKMVRDITQKYEHQFLERRKQLQEDNSTSEKLNSHLDGLMYQISGNLVWSLNAPRYHPDARYDPNAGLEDGMTAKSMPATLGIDYDVRFIHKAKEDPYQPSRTCPDSKSGHLRKDSTQSLTTPDKIASTGCLDSEHVKEPLRYIKSLPSKGVRDSFINALNSWVSVPALNVLRIKSVGNRLHCASLVLDDIEDRSSLRRGQPAAHTVFGTAQTINSGCYEILKAVEEAQHLGPKAVKIVLEELDDLHIGQSYDLYWTQHNLCPSEDEYLEMVTKKTGGVFRLITRLLLDSSEIKASDKHLITDIEHLVRLIGIQYQIRDDYQNLYCKTYSEKKGFCQDLDEGKFSFPLIHALSAQSDSTKLLRELLQRRRDVGCLSYEQKMLVLKQLDCVGSMAYTREMLKWLEGEVYEVVNKIEGATKMENWILRALLLKLEI
jgi:ophiobolin F synthase